MSLTEATVGHILKYGEEATLSRDGRPAGAVVAWITQANGKTYAHVTPADADKLQPGDRLDAPTTAYTVAPPVARCPWAVIVRLTPLKEESDAAD